jgi:hypothetical protein
LFEQHEVKLLRVLTDRGSEYCGNPERHEYELYLAVEDIDHSRDRADAARRGAPLWPEPRTDLDGDRTCTGRTRLEKQWLYGDKSDVGLAQQQPATPDG